MRNTVLVLMGQQLEPSALGLKQYILQQGESAVCDFLQVVHYLPAATATPGASIPSAGADGPVTLSHCRRVEQPETTFCSDLSEQYTIALSDAQTLANDEELSHWWAQLFSRTVTLQHQGESPCLHVVAVVPLWDPQLVAASLRLARCLQVLSHDIILDLLALPPTIAHLFDADQSVSAGQSNLRRTTAREQYALLIEARRQRQLKGIIMIEGCNTSGIALDMDYSTWLRIVGEFSLLLTENYTALFPVTLTPSQSDCTTFGLSILQFDKYYFIHYLLRRAYLKILGREQVQQTQVDINKVANIAQEQLLKHYHIFTQIYEKEVEPMQRQNLDEKAILGRITEQVDRETRLMIDDFQSFVDREDLSLPEKQATLAQLLGLNDKLYAGNLFARDQLVYEDCGSDVIDAFVRENNLLEGEGPLTTPRDDEGHVYSPIEQLKQSRLKITESTRFIAYKSEEMKQWQQQVTESIEVEKRLTPEGFIYGDVTYRVMADQEVKLFEEDYQPRDVKAESVDMRSMFTPIRDQGQIGACTVFAMVGVYEFLLKKLGKPKSDLSEHFVYYNVLIDKHGKVVDEGSSILDVAASMSDKGVCVEELCRYDGTLKPPTPEAYTEARNHLVKKALNVPLSSDMAQNHRALTSALADGYPVIISLKLYDSFSDGIKGFVPRPSADERRHDKHGNHCMVICGYSNEEKVYIVRNSWGKSFGDEGYCYIPFSYIDDSQFLNQAAIISEIAESNQLGGFDHVVVPKVSFSTTDANIRYAIARNQIEEEKVRLAIEETRYQSLATAYYRLTSDLENNGIRRQILDGAERRLQKSIDEVEEQKRQFTTVTYPTELRQLKQSQRGGWLVIWSTLATWLLVLGVFLSYQTLREWVDSDFWITMSVIGGILVLLVGIYKYVCTSAYNNLERELNQRRDQMAKHLLQLRRELSTKHLKLHIAGMMIECINKVQHQLDHKYKLLCGYVGNLSQWMSDEEQALQQMEVKEKNPFIPILDNSILDRFFDQHQDEITQPIRLYRLLDKVGLKDDDVIRYKREVRDQVAALLSQQYAGFSMADYVLNYVRYPYLSDAPADIARLMGKMNRQSDCFLQLRSTGTIDRDLSSRYVLLHVTDPQKRQRWQSEYPRYFQQQPSDLPTFVSPFKLIELQVKHLSHDAVEWLA